MKGCTVLFEMNALNSLNHIYEPRHEKNNTFWFPTWSNTNVQLQKIARCLKFRIKKVEGLFYLCSENKGGNQLRGYREADLRLCFHICKK